MFVKRLGLMVALLILVCILFMTLGAKGSWTFTLPFRGAKLGGLILVGIAVSTSTILFQTLTHNRILTPSIMGFDALYVLILSLAVFILGAQNLVRLPEKIQFVSVLILLVAVSLALFGTLLTSARTDLMRMILTGVILGVLFRSLSSFITRMIDPNEYAVIQISSYARFNRIDTDLLGISAVLCGAALLYTWSLRHQLDVLSLGHDTAINLGETPRRATLNILCIISTLVSVSTALVGPIAFLGLLVASLAHLVTPTARHTILLPSAALIAAITLVGGQMILERVLNLSTPLSVVIDALGGILFLILLLRTTIR